MLCALMLLAAGCPPTPQQPTAAPDKAELAAPAEAQRDQKLVANQDSRPEEPLPQDAPPPVGVIIHLQVYELLVPYGAVSQNEAFWKRINEQVVSVEVADRLWRNGVRIGEAPAAEWPYFKSIIDQNPAMARQTTHTAREAKDIEIPVRSEEPFLNLFFFSEDGLVGRSYERCVSGLSLSFQPTPRKLGSVRVALTPYVRSVRRHLEFSGNAEWRTIDYVTPEFIYDLNLRADIPLDSFIVVAPSTEARVTGIIGGHFLTVSKTTEKLERVILLVPVPVPVEIKPVDPRQIVLPRPR